MFQANQAYVQIVGVTGGADSWFNGRGWVVGLALAMLVGAVIIGGIRSIARVTAKVVPFMAVLYLLGAILIIAMNFEAIPWAFDRIIEGAFEPGGGRGWAAWRAKSSASSARSSPTRRASARPPLPMRAVRTHEPMTEGFVALLEPFIDNGGNLYSHRPWVRDHHLLLRAPAGRRPGRHPDHFGRIRSPYLLVPLPPRPGRHPVRSLDHGLLVILRAEGLDLPRGAPAGAPR